MVAVAIEMLTAQQGLGYAIWLAWQTFRVSELYAVLAIIALVGVSINWLLDWLSSRLVLI